MNSQPWCLRGENTRTPGLSWKSSQINLLNAFAIDFAVKINWIVVSIEQWYQKFSISECFGLLTINKKPSRCPGNDGWIQVGTAPDNNTRSQLVVGTNCSMRIQEGYILLPKRYTIHEKQPTQLPQNVEQNRSI